MFLSRFRKKEARHELDVAFFMAVKNIFHRKAMLMMIVAIIGLGYLSTMFSSSIIQGLKYTIEEKVITGTTGHVIIQPDEDHDYLANVKELEKRILGVPNVIAVSPRIDTYMALIDRQGSKLNVPVRIIYPEKEYYATNLYRNIMEGQYLSSSSELEILLGAEATKEYRMIQGSDAIDVKAGDIVDSVIEYGGTRIETKVKIRGIYGQKFMFTDGFAYISDKAVKKLFNISDGTVDIANTIVVTAKGRGYEDQIISDLKDEGIPGRIWKWTEKLGMLNQFIESLMIISNLTAVIGVVIAFATIYIMVYINVLQKRSQIGIMKAIGITERTILISYIIQSFIYGLLGSLFGILLTVCVLGYIRLNPISMPLGDVRPVTDAFNFAFSAVFLLASAVVAGYMASEGVIKEKILDAIFKG